MKNKKGSDLNISASAIETFRDCQRKWYFGYVERIRGPKSPAAERGDKIHDLAERYLKGEVDPEALEGEDAKWFRYLMPGLEYAPTPGQVAADGWGVEDWVKEPCGPLNFVGKVDFYNVSLDDGPVICDWKTTGNAQWRWSKTPEQLAGFLQPHVYAYSLLKDNPPDTVSFQHVNLQSRGRPDAMQVWANEVPWEHIEQTWETVKDISHQMATIAKANETAETVNPNTKACKKFGGCEHADICSASPRNRATPHIPNYTPGVTMATNSNETQDKMAALRARLGIGKAKPAITPEPTPAPEPAPAPAKRSAKEQVLEVLQKADFVPAPVMEWIAGDESEQVAKEIGLTLQDNKWVKAAKPEEFSDWGMPVRQYNKENGTASIPNNARVVAGLLVPVSFDGTTQEAVEMWGTDSQKHVAEVLEEHDPTPAPAPSAAKDKYDLDTRKAARLILEALRDKDSVDKGEASDIVRNNTSWKRISKGRWQDVADCATEIATIKVYFDEESGALGWRPTPIEETPAPVEETPAPVEETPEIVAGELIEGATIYRDGFDAGYAEGRKEGAAISGESAQRTIYVNCVPLREDYCDFAEWVREAEGLVAAEQGVPYYGLVPYAQGTKMVAAKMQHAIDNGHLPPSMYVDSYHPCAAEFIAIVSALPGIRVIKALR
jgi:hypothetical protein